ncbi:hypothetical protein [Leptospira stimsonii]|uniref:Uncharacterized protein n=1 Tax=Leptospira stimsonii TaxID=2202203 RepID=A0ABY2MV78_9LEPT|nr:hypothetical protein [Leptospira stimsonii]TGK25398.1 hypothetical protein EHO98_03085 [Leptospira stimsonii]TGM08817.1 hypothetical protein EHQ90_22270 [Leptospira stimsonii]
MKVTTVEFSHGKLSLYAHKFESGNLTLQIKGYLQTFKLFKDFAHDLSPGEAWAVICSSSSNPNEATEKTGTILIHFSNGREHADVDLIVSSETNPEKKIAIARIRRVLSQLATLSKQEFVLA